MKNEENPFINKKVAKEWINSVENEKDSFRDRAIYPLLSKWASKNKPKLIIEIGSGQGVCSDQINLKNKNYIGIEPSKILVERSKELYKAENIKFIVGNAYKLPIKKDVVDSAFSVMVWFHLKDITKASKELSRILKPRGTFFIITANPNNYSAWEKSFFDYKKDKTKISGKVNVPVNPMSKNIIYLHSADKIINSLTNSGLKITSIKQFGDFGKGKQFVAIYGYK